MDMESCAGNQGLKDQVFALRAGIRLKYLYYRHFFIKNNKIKKNLKIFFC